MRKLFTRETGKQREARNQGGLPVYLTGFFSLIFLLLLNLTFSETLQAAVRAKDISNIQGMQTKKLIGYGLVIGLDGSGDTRRSMVSLQTATNMLRRFGISLPKEPMQLRNIAAVMITANLPAFMPTGSMIDVQVSSMGDAKSLEGGTLVLSPLVDTGGALFAHAQGAVSVGGYNIESIGGDRIRKNFTLAGRIPNGATLVRSSEITSLPDSALFLTLNSPDFTTAVKLATAINTTLNNQIAGAMNAVQVRVAIPVQYQTRVAEFISLIENTEVEPDVPARVVVNERTGTVIVGENVTISPVAIAHGNLRIEVKNSPIVSQPAPFSQGKTTVVPNTQTTVSDTSGKMLAFDASANIKDVARVLNALGVTPRDLVAIFQALKEAGALKAELVIM
ncbi:MAG: flagellar basal body P-ring protein FlgI [Deferribacteres bacterium]|nr:flagellar basal body P-ring protein FlgI [candidate division KSB1 bacterium]MCB9501960.1 flagellar basal body P-ring protein FlgI [Deferribacteres bacterium]